MKKGRDGRASVDEGKVPPNPRNGRIDADRLE